MPNKIKPFQVIKLADRKKKAVSQSLVGRETAISHSIGELLDVFRKTHLRLNAGQIETKDGSVMKLCPEGTPDRLFFDALAIFVEVKRPGESLRPEQVQKIKELKDAGAVVVVCRDSLEAEKVLRVLNVHRIKLIQVKAIAQIIQRDLDALGFDR